MRASLLWLAAVLPMAASPSVRSSPSLSLGFERTASGYLAQSMGGAIQINAQGAGILSRAGQVRIEVRGANPRAKLTAAGDAGSRNRFIGNDPSKWRMRIPLFARVQARAVYPGIDMAWYGRDAKLEYDFVVAPGADPRRIAVAFDGSRAVRLTAGGDLRVESAAGELIQHRPLAYQIVQGKRREVPSRFVLANNRIVRFALGAYDRSLPLTIDPVATYSGYAGGTGTSEGLAVAVDSSGNFYVAGATYSTTNGNSNVLLLKVLASGSPVQSIFGGTTGEDMANAIVVDSSQNVYLAGSTSSTDFPDTGNVPLQTEEGIDVLKAFILSLDAANTGLTYSGYFGGSEADEALGLALGSNGYLYIVGDTTSSDFLAYSLDGALIACPTTSATPAFQCSNFGGYDAFLVVMSDQPINGALVFAYATYIGGSGDDHAYGVAVDSSGNAYVTGMTASTDFPVCPGGTNDPNVNCGLTGTAFQTALAGAANAFAIEISQNGTSTGSYGDWSTYVGGSGSDAANALALDPSNNLYLAGTTSSTNFPVSSGAYQTSYQGGNSDGFVFALENTGTQGIWSTYLGSPGDDVINSIALDSSTNIYVTGATDGTAYPVTVDAVQSANAGTENVVVSKLNNSGTSLLFSTYFGGDGSDIGRGIAVDSSGNIYFGGITTSSNFPIVSGSYTGLQTAYGGGASDGFLAVIGCPVGTPVIGAGGVGNGASYSANAISPGAVIAIFGTDLSCSATAAASLPLPTSLGGVTVEVNGAAIPLYYVSETQINAQLPYDIPVGSATMTITGPGGTSAAASFAVVAAAPGIFEINGQAAALNSDGTVNTTTNPAQAGSYVAVFFTGQGPVSPSVATGAAALGSPLSYLTSTNSATIGGQNANVYFMGLAPGLVGLGQANLQIPNLAAGDYPLVVTINGVASQSATISVSN
jgi:uncharacterized protein (TIGR03437 family)